MKIEGKYWSYSGQVDKENKPCGIGRALDNRSGRSFYGTWLERKRHGIRKCCQILV